MDNILNKRKKNFLVSFIVLPQNVATMTDGSYEISQPK